jgi:hypothetical protein
MLLGVVVVVVVVVVVLFFILLLLSAFLSWFIVSFPFWRYIYGRCKQKSTRSSLVTKHHYIRISEISEVQLYA